MDSVVVQLKGPTVNAIYQSFRALFDTLAPGFLPATAGDLHLPLIKGGYRLDAQMFRVRREKEDGTATWDRGLHADFLIARLDATKDSVMSLLRTLRSTAKSSGFVKTDLDTPANMLEYFGVPQKQLWLDPTYNVWWSLDTADRIQEPYHMFAGVTSYMID